LIIEEFFGKLYDLGLLKLYEKILLNEIDWSEDKLPKHVGVIMDGNRRLAQKLNQPPFKGHELGAKKVREFIRWCVDSNIRIITLYSFSIENFRRPPGEVNKLMDLFEKEFKKIADDEEIHKKKIRIRCIGRRKLLPKRVLKAVEYAEEKTKEYNDYYVNVALAYGGQQEIVDAVKKICKKVKEGELNIEDITEETIHEHLYTCDLPNPDLIIRTSGEERISNFLIWQSSYAELYFCETYWPQFRKIDFLRAIRDYQRRKRRFGV